MPTEPYSESDEKRFWERVRKSDACWVWVRGCFAGKYSYGAFRAAGKLRKAHRVSWELANGRPIPPGLMVCHRCDNPPCVRPEHLFLGTNQDNQRDASAKGRSPFGERSAPRRFPERLRRGDAHWTRAHPEKLPDQRGAANRASKLDDAAVLDMRARRAAGEALKVIGADYGVAFQTVSKIVRGQRWTHVVKVG